MPGDSTGLGELETAPSPAAREAAGDRSMFWKKNEDRKITGGNPKSIEG
jgi:hypothetical protein